MAKLIASLLHSSVNWTQGALGRKADGTPVQCLDVLFTSNARTGQYEENDPSKDIKSYSLYGAIAHCYDIDRRDQVLDKLRSAIEKITGRIEPIAAFNDRPETTHKEILSVARMANV